jgi:toxin ParE1/3/4
VAKFFVAPEALDDLELIGTYIAQDNPEAADRVIDAAYRLCQVLADHPELGRLRRFPNHTPLDLRSFVIPEFPNYIIFYRANVKGIEIVRVVHGARDVERLFDD